MKNGLLPGGGRLRITNSALALISTLLLIPGWLGVSGLPLLAALVPLMVVSGRADASRRAAWRVFGWVALTFGAWSVATTWWIAHAALIGAVLSPVITVGLMGGAFMLYHYVSKRAPRALACTVLATAWIAAEYLYTTGQVSFPWLTLGNGFAWDIKLVQWYDTTGVFGGSLWVLLCNILIYEAVCARRARRWIAAGVVVVLPMAVSLFIYYTYLPWKAKMVKSTVIQPNLDPYEEKFALSMDEQTALLLDMIRQTPSDADYIVTPETSLPEMIREGEFRFSSTLAEFRGLARYEFPNTQFILGATTMQIYPDDLRTATARNRNGVWFDVYNSVLGLDTTEHIQVRHKSMLLVGVEKIPYYNLFKHIEFLVVDMGGITGQLGCDPEPYIFRAQNGRVSGAGVCWEGVFGAYMGGFVRKGAQILFIVSNDGWWGDTQGYRQLFALSRLRAVELRRSIARSANTGISGLITDRGDVTEKMGWDVRGTATGLLPLNDKLTFYVRYGDYIGRIASYAFLLSVLYYVAYRTRRRNHLVE